MALNSSLLKRLVALGCACALSLGASACGSKKSSNTTSSPTASTSFTHMDGITATGNLGEKPAISFDSLPYSVHNDSYAILQTGDGDTVQDGQRICLQNMFVNTDDGSVLSSSWDSDPKDCATITSSQTPSDYYGLLVGQKVHTTIAIGYNLDESSSSSSAAANNSDSTDSTDSTDTTTATNSAERLASVSQASTGLSSLAAMNDFTATVVDDESSSATSSDSSSSDSSSADSSSASSSDSSSATNVNSHYLWVFTIMSTTTPATRASGTEVTDLPSGLPTVTRDSSTGEPSIDMSTYSGSTTSLVAQTLIQGTGDTVQEGDSIDCMYSGWLTDGTQFDSNWSSGTSTQFTVSESSLIKGFVQGLVGQKVGSQVLLIIPPDLGYGSTAQGSIPANSTLIFVVDILYDTPARAEVRG
ncbi:MAG: FKBP-type peptidyl-prolyl cis-trans isomerase [Bifidobacteriaceae bacterium]|nr:FKBP-type peptidyl-prolyl cis-trans isomerase [Bifidobacteriaceae bacterium]